MNDYIVKYKYQYIDDIELNGEKILTVEDNIYIKPNPKDKNQDIEFESDQMIEGILLEILKDYLRSETVELISFAPVIDRDFDIYKLTY